MNLRLTFAAAFATLAASTALSPLVSGTTWFWAGAGAVAVAAAAGGATRVRVLPVALCLPTALAGEFLYLNAAFAGPQSWAWLVPTGGSLHHLAALASQAMSQTARYAPPVPPRRSIALAAAAGVGLIAVTTDLVAVRLRKPALAGLPLLVLFCVPLTTTARSDPLRAALVFVLGMAGYLTLLSADGRERLRLWGHVATARGVGPDSRRLDTRPLGAAGRRIGFAAVLLALFIPTLAPGLRHHPLFGGAGPRPGPGGGTISLPDPIDQLNKELHTSRPQTVLTYRTTDQVPPYLQVYVLDRLNANSWSLAAPASTATLGPTALPRVPGLSAGTHAVSVREAIRLSADLSSGPATLSYLPIPYAPRAVQVAGRWRVDRGSLSVMSADARLGGLAYTVTSTDVNPSPRQLRAAPAPPPSMAGYLTFPAQFGRLTGLADRITAGRSTAYDKAVALQNWFTRPGNFAYTLDAPEPTTPGALVRFLTKTKRGYCQQFAFGMAVLARVLSIPSRVVVGYTQGVPIGNGAWQVTTSDAHAWPELYFQGAGWLRFEPTPAGSPGHAGQATASTPPYTYTSGLGGIPAPSPTSSATQPDAAPTGGKPAGSGAVAKLNRLAGGQGGTAASPAPAPFPAGPLTLAVAVLLLLAPGAARLLLRRLRWLRAATDAERAHAAWRELRCDLLDHRVRSRPSETPRALARRLAGELRLGPRQQASLERLARAEERAGYAPSPEAPDRLRAEAAVVRRALGRASGLRGRCAALIAPVSVLVPVRNALANALDLFGWIDALGTGLRRRVRRRRAAVAPRRG